MCLKQRKAYRNTSNRNHEEKLIGTHLYHWLIAWNNKKSNTEMILIIKKYLRKLWVVFLCCALHLDSVFLSALRPSSFQLNFWSKSANPLPPPPPWWLPQWLTFAQNLCERCIWLVTTVALKSNTGQAPLSVPGLKKISIQDLNSSLFVSDF